MVNYYVDIKIISKVGREESILMNNIFKKVHYSIVKLKTNKIGISFPNYNIKLGNILRIHGDKDILEKLFNFIKDTKNFRLSEIKKIPDNSKFRIISRIHNRYSKSKLNRLRKRGSIFKEEEKDYLKKMCSSVLNNPFINIKSESNNHNFKLFIDFGEIIDKPLTGEFNCYGLSKKAATIPWFKNGINV